MYFCQCIHTHSVYKGKLFHFDISICCADIELRSFVYIFLSIDERSRLILYAWMLISCIINIILPVYLRCVFFVIFYVYRVNVLACHPVIIFYTIQVLWNWNIYIGNLFTFVIPQHWQTYLLLSDFFFLWLVFVKKNCTAGNF